MSDLESSITLMRYPSNLDLGPLCTCHADADQAIACAARRNLILRAASARSVAS